MRNRTSFFCLSVFIVAFTVSQDCDAMRRRRRDRFPQGKETIRIKGFGPRRTSIDVLDEIEESLPPEEVREAVFLNLDLKEFTVKSVRYRRIPLFWRYRSLSGRKTSEGTSMGEFIHFYLELFYLVVQKYGGEVFDEEGDGFFAVFYLDGLDEVERQRRLEDSVACAMELIHKTRVCFRIGKTVRGWTKLGCRIGMKYGIEKKRGNRRICTDICEAARYQALAKGPAVIPEKMVAIYSLIIGIKLFNALSDPYSNWFNPGRSVLIRGIGVRTIYGCSGFNAVQAYERALRRRVRPRTMRGGQAGPSDLPPLVVPLRRPNARPALEPLRHESDQTPRLPYLKSLERRRRKRTHSAALKKRVRPGGEGNAAACPAPSLPIPFSSGSFPSRKSPRPSHLFSPRSGPDGEELELRRREQYERRFVESPRPDEIDASVEVIDASVEVEELEGRFQELEVPMPPRREDRRRKIRPRRRKKAPPLPLDFSIGNKVRREPVKKPAVNFPVLGQRASLYKPPKSDRDPQ